MRGSNPRPSPCKGDALPTELILLLVTHTGLEPVSAWMKTMCVNRFTNGPLAPDTRFELVTKGLTVLCSTAELIRQH
ncbi:hypothetical protein ElyMa_003913700 [Elysia marginata]|uniref:Uncharacterized protein n=1 Tax=Elysia marginata TaxID=1093978 RepID=A0AAV4FSA2_9GAST|nr:hypothetical protein ElyMa_003913700 [Elysia marginata]